MTRNSRRLQKAVQAIFNDYREKASCPGQVYQNAACGCDNALQMWRGPKGDKGDQGPQGPKGDNAGSFLVNAEFVVDPEGQEPGAYLKLVLIDVAQQEQVVYVDLSYLTDIYTGGNGISITDMVVAARLGAGLTFDANGNIASAYQFCDGLDETSNVVKVRLDSSNRILGFASGTCGGLTATVGLAPSATGVNLVLTGAGGAVLSTIPLEGGTGITVQKNAQTGGFTWLADPAGLVSSQTGNQLSVSQTDNKLYVGGNTLEYTFGTGAFTLKDSSGATLSSVTVPSAVRMLEDMELRTDDGIYLHLTYLRDNGLHAYQDVSLDELLCNNVDTADDTSAAYSKAVPSGNWQTAAINEIGGKTVVWNQLLTVLNSSQSKTLNGVSLVDNRDGTYTVSTETGGATADAAFSFTKTVANLQAGHKYLYRCTPAGGSLTTYYAYLVNNSILPAGRDIGNGFFYSPTGSSVVWEVIFVVSGAVITTPIVFKPRLFDLTLMFGAGNEPSTVAEFEAMFPAEYYAYDAGTLKSAGVTEVESEGVNKIPPIAAVTKTSNSITAVSDGIGTVTFTGTASAFSVFTFDLPKTVDIPVSTSAGGTYALYINNSFTAHSFSFLLDGAEIATWNLGTANRVITTWSSVEGKSFDQIAIKISSGAATNGTVALAFLPYDGNSEAHAHFIPYMTATLPIPSAVQSLPGYGWSAGTAYNYIDFDRKVYVQNVGSVVLGSLTWTKGNANNAGTGYVFYTNGAASSFASTAYENSIIANFTRHSPKTDPWEMYAVNEYTISASGYLICCANYTDAASFKAAMQGVMLQYELATPVETDISSLLSDSTIEVEPGGSLTFKNQHDDFRLPVPNSETFIYEHPWVFEDCIKELVWKELEPYSSSIADVSASFECRAVAQPIAPAFNIGVCDYWDDGESDGCYSSDYLNDTLDFSVMSGVETKLGTLSLANNTPDNPVVSFSMGDVSTSTQTPLTLARRELLVSGDASALYGSGASSSVSSLAVGDSLAFTFSNIGVTEYDGTYYTGRTITLDAPTQTVEISSEVLGTFTVSARVVREPDVDGKFTVSFYATATLADASTSTVPTLTLTTTDVSGTTHEQEIDMSCISADISLDAGCREVVVTPATAEPFDDYLLSGSINTLLLNADGTISDLKHANPIPVDNTARGSVTMELFNPESTDGLSIELYAKQSSGNDSRNYYSNVDEADAQKCATLADFLAAGEQGLPLIYADETSFSGVTPLAENETLYASVVSNGNSSYTFTFTVRAPEVTETRLILDLVSGDNRTDLKPLLGYVGGKVDTVAVPSGDAVQLSFGYAGAGYIFGSRRSDFPTVGLFANSAEDICNRTNLIQPTSVGPGTDTFTYYFETMPTHFAIPSISEVDATGTKVGTTSYASPMLDMETMRCTGEGTVLADIPEAGLVYTEYDTSSRPFVPTGRTLRLRATVGNAGIVFTLWQQETVDKPVLCLEPSCDPCIDLSPVMDTVDEMIDDKIAPIQEQVTQNTARIDALEEAMFNNPAFLPTAVEAFYAVRRTGKVYQVKFPTWDTAHTVAGEKLLDNAGLVCVPSTDTVEGQDDYADIPMFQWMNVNYARNADGSPYPTAIEGSNAYKTTGSVDVGAMQMSFYYRVHVENGYQYWTVSDSPHPELNLVPWPECVKADGTVLPWCIGSKYMAGRAPDGTPRSLPGLDLWNRDMSYNNAVTYFQRKGAGYQGAGMEAGLFNLLFMVIKYATKNLNTVMYGCFYYTYYGYVALAETDATRILLPANDARFLPNTYIQSGTSTVANRDRGYADAYDVCDHAKILSVEQVTVDGVTYTALNIDKTVTTTLGGVVITTPFNAGATDSVLGHHDGSPVDNNSGHWPCRVQGREQFVGAWCLSCDVAMNTVTSLDQEIWWAPKGVTRSTNTTVIQDTYRNIGTVIGNSGTSFWIGDIDVYNGEGLWVPSKVGQSNSTGWCDRRWVSAGVGWREHLWGGALLYGTYYGPVAWNADNALSGAGWGYAARD